MDIILLAFVRIDSSVLYLLKYLNAVLVLSYKGHINSDDQLQPDWPWPEYQCLQLVC